MALIINDKTLRNLEEQVQYLTDFHNVNQALASWGIRVVGQVTNADDLPQDYQGEYGDTYAVGSNTPYDFYIWTRASNVSEGAYWFNFGEISIVGPQGPQGEKGEKGETGDSTKWYTSVPSNPIEGDMLLNINGQVYRYQGGAWVSQLNIKGPQGIQGERGPQGIQGPQGPRGLQGPQGAQAAFIHILGELTSESQLPTPTSLNDLSAAYLVNGNLYIQIGTTVQDALWKNTGPFNVGTDVTVNGQHVTSWNADTKLDKLADSQITPGISYVTTLARDSYDSSAYIGKTSLQVTGQEQYSIPLYSNNYVVNEPTYKLNTGNPVHDYQCANKAYVDSKITDHKLYKVRLDFYGEWVGIDRNSFTIYINAHTNYFPPLSAVNSPIYQKILTNQIGVMNFYGDGETTYDLLNKTVIQNSYGDLYPGEVTIWTRNMFTDQNNTAWQATSVEATVLAEITTIPD